MKNSLSHMTLEQLWRLFPIELREYNPHYPMWYEGARRDLDALLGGEILRISHIGSTAVPGLLCKPIVDILLEVDIRSGFDGMADRLRQDGWLLMDRSDLQLSFNKGYTPEGFADRVFHLHMRAAGDWDELYFRDYLIAVPDAAEEYVALKRSLADTYRYDRDGYTAAKGEFIRLHTQRARALLGSIFNMEDV